MGYQKKIEDFSKLIQNYQETSIFLDFIQRYTHPKVWFSSVNLTLDELEAIRLADLTELYQEDAAKKMNVSRQTFGNIINSAHKKIADALLNAKALKIEGGNIERVD